MDTKDVIESINADLGFYRKWLFSNHIAILIIQFAIITGSTTLFPSNSVLLKIAIVIVYILHNCFFFQ